MKRAVRNRRVASASLESVEDFLIKLDMKPCMHVVEISIFSLNLVIVRVTKIMNRADKKLGTILGNKVSYKSEFTKKVLIKVGLLVKYSS